MAWLRKLNEIQGADLPLIGHQAHCLGQLHHGGLPVADGWVLTAEAWYDHLDHVLWPDQTQDGLAHLEAHLEVGAFQSLQQLSQGMQRGFQAASQPQLPNLEGFPWAGTNLQSSPALAWMLQASLWVDTPAHEAIPDLILRPGLAAQIGSGPAPAFRQGLLGFWQQALTAPSLLVWRHHCRRLRDLGLATLVMPVYPAQVSGTLKLTTDQASLEVVQGLGLALSRGEAIPARCQLPLAQLRRPSPPLWEPGWQEQVYHLNPNIGNPHIENPDIKAWTTDQAAALALQVIPRQAPGLPPPLEPEQVAELVELGQQAQAILGGPDVRLDWILCPGSDPTRPRLIITQATSERVQPSGTSAQPWSGPGMATSPRLQPPTLPAVSTVVQGIGASSGQIQGVAVVATRPQELPSPLPPGCIVVLPDLQPDVFLQLQAVAGIVTERGGATCHAAILAREMGVPAVVGAPQATQLLEHETVLWLDGDRGIVYGLDGALLSPTTPPSSPVVPSVQQVSTELATQYRALRTKVMVNLSQASRLATLPIDHIAGIGLLRSEWLLLDILEGRHPWHWVNQGLEAELQGRIVQQLKPILQALGPKPLRYRTLDLRSHEWQGLEGSPPVESNPMLGLRGTLSYEVDARLFEIELAALATLQQAGYGNIQLILPFVRTVEEVTACRRYVVQAGLTDYEGFALWIMAEVPSVLFLMPAYAQAGVQGIAIGSNDLTQLLLAVDRDQPTLASAYDERHPVVRLAMAHLVREAQRCGMVCSICGQAPVRHPELIADLVAWGINSISVEAAALPFTLKTVWQAEQSLAQ